MTRTHILIKRFFLEVTLGFNTRSCVLVGFLLCSFPWYQQTHAEEVPLSLRYTLMYGKCRRPNLCSDNLHLYPVSRGVDKNSPYSRFKNEKQETGMWYIYYILVSIYIHTLISIDKSVLLNDCLAIYFQ